MKKDTIITEESENSPEVYIYFFASDDHPNDDKNNYAVKSTIDYDKICLLYLNVQFMTKYLFKRFLSPKEVVQVFEISDLPIFDTENEDLEEFYGEQIHFEDQLTTYYYKKLSIDSDLINQFPQLISKVYQESSNYDVDSFPSGKWYEWIDREERYVDRNEMVQFFEDKLFSEQNRALSNF